jgi:cell division protease FtsH
MYLPEGDKYTNRRKELLDHLVVIMGGRVAEELIFGDVTNGARGDISQASGIARKMVCEWGMSDRLGMVDYGEHDDFVFLGRDLNRGRSFSEATAEEIDHEVKKLCDDAYNRARQIITTHRDKLEIIARALLEFETLDGEQVKDIAQTGRMSNPPAPPSGGVKADATPATPAPAPAGQPTLDFPGGLSGAHA